MKKKYTFRIVCIAVYLLFAMTVKAYDFESGGIYYNITSLEDLTVEVTYKNFLEEYSGKVVIPESVIFKGQQYKVTTLGSSAFEFCEELITVVLPSSILKIGHSAFRGCTSLSNIILPNSIQEIEDYAFSGCINLADLIIPHNVRIIGWNAFSGCTGLSGIMTIPNSVIKIKSEAFAGCTGLTSIIIGSGLDVLEDGIFKDCSGLTSINIPSNIKAINIRAFSGCTGLTSIVIPRYINKVGWGAFADCYSLTKVTFEAESILEREIFYGCSNLKEIHCNSKLPPKCLSNSFSNLLKLTVCLYIPPGSYSNYKTAEGWKDFVNIMEEGIYHVSLIQNDGGQVWLNDQSDLSSITPGASVTIKVIPYENYKIKQVILNDRDITTALQNGCYTIDAVNENLVLNVVFEEISIYLTIQHADNGQLSQIVQKGESYAYKIIPAENWFIHTVTYNETDVTDYLDENNIFRTPAIENSSVLSVSFINYSGFSDLRQSSMKIYAFGNKLIIEEAEPGEKIGIYLESGLLVREVRIVGDRTEVMLPANRVYFVKNGRETIKVRL